MESIQKVNMNHFACTTMIVEQDATIDGLVIVADSDDDVSDEKVIYVPPKTWNLTSSE